MAAENSLNFKSAFFLEGGEKNDRPPGVSASCNDLKQQVHCTVVLRTW